MSHKGLVAVACVLGLFGVAVVGPALLSKEPEADAEPARGRPIRPEPRPEVREGPLKVEIVDASGDRLPTFAHGDKTWVEGAMGRRYQIKLTNTSSRRVEAVVSVDGLDVLDGKTASFEKRGYLVPAFGSTTIEGFRRSLDEVATFRFSTVDSSYAARKGDDRNVGVIGVAVFQEEVREPIAMPRAGEADRGRSGGAAPPPGAAPAPKAGAPRDESAQGMGTGWGEDRTSRVRETSFSRASSRPFSVVELRYDDRAGLVAKGVLPDREPPRRREPLPFPAEDRRFAEPPT